MLRARIFESLSNPAAAEEAYLTAMAENPNDSQLRTELGDLYTRQGLSTQALAAYEAALAIRPGSVEAIRKLLNHRSIPPDGPITATLLAAALDDQRTRDAQARHLFLLGQIYVDAGLDTTGFEFYRAGNAKIAHQHADNAREYHIPTAVSTLAHRLQRSGHPDGNTGHCPAVIVTGLPRSGKSLVEQLLVQSPAIVSGGELAHVRKLATDLETSGALDSAIAQPDHPARTRLTAAYNAARRDPAVRYIVDTSPANLKVLGYLGLLYPTVPIVFCTRRVDDLGVSIYFKKFRRGHLYSYQLAQLGRAVARSEQLIALWTSLLPNPCLTIPYEALVQDPSATLQRLHAYLGVSPVTPPHPSSTALSGTPSWRIFPSRSIDHTAGISSSLVGFAERFANQLHPLMDAYGQETGRGLR